MTREEAIEILEEVKTIDDSMYQFSPKYMDALGMVIEDAKFLEFLANIINPNEMEQYLAMFHRKEEKNEWS